MELTCTVQGRCGGGTGGHLNLTVTSGARSLPIALHRSDLLAAPDLTDDEWRAAIIILIRYLAKQNNVTTVAGLVTLINGRTVTI